jgi:hypothetical protein
VLEDCIFDYEMDIANRSDRATLAHDDVQRYINPKGFATGTIIKFRWTCYPRCYAARIAFTLAVVDKGVWKCAAEQAIDLDPPTPRPRQNHVSARCIVCGHKAEMQHVIALSESYGFRV